MFSSINKSVLSTNKNQNSLVDRTQNQSWVRVLEKEEKFWVRGLEKEEKFQAKHGRLKLKQSTHHHHIHGQISLLNS